MIQGQIYNPATFGVSKGHFEEAGTGIYIYELIYTYIYIYIYFCIYIYIYLDNLNIHPPKTASPPVRKLLFSRGSHGSQCITSNLQIFSGEVGLTFAAAHTANCQVSRRPREAVEKGVVAIPLRIQICS